jgi:zinc transporter ZupT
MLELITSLKIMYIFLITAVVYVAFIPMYCKVCRNSQRMLGVLNSFAGGIFLAMAFIHILPEANEEYNEMYKDILLDKGMTEEEVDETHIFPTPFVVFFMGYAVVLFIDRVLGAHFSNDPKSKRKVSATEEIIQTPFDHGHAHHDHHGNHDHCSEEGEDKGKEIRDGESNFTPEKTKKSVDIREQANNVIVEMSAIATNNNSPDK